MKRELPFSNPCLEGLEPRLLLSTSGLAGPEAFESGGIPAYIDIELPEKPADDVVSSRLRQAHAALEAGGDVGSLGFDVRANEAGELQVYVHVDAVNGDIIRALEAAGLRVETSNARMRVVQGWLPHTDLDLAAAVEGVRRITPPAYGITNSGSVTTEGDADLNADDLRALFGGITGDGVKIGVISNGVDNWGYVAAEPYNDLPDSITVDPTRPGTGNGDEGTAMLEIIYDVAPGAYLYFSGPETSAEMVASIDWLVNTCGVDVIVDDWIFFDEPMFEDGPIADEAADAVTDGVVYLSAAGNWAEVHYQATYDPYYGYHEFATDQNLLRFELDPGGKVQGEFQWSDEWGSSGNDYNLYLCKWVIDEWVLVDYSIDVQNGDDEPRESIGWVENTGQNTAYYAWAIYKASGSDRELELTMYYTDPNKIRPYEADEGIMVPEDSIYGHAALEEVIAVGAIDTGDAGLDDVEDYSSRGPSTIYTNFSTQTSTERDSLDVCGIDGVQTKAGQLGHFSNPFFGTSAAAPHIAGIAALLLEIDSSLTPSDIQDLITDNAVDIGDGGYDHVSGSGRADALAIVTADPPQVVAVVLNPDEHRTVRGLSSIDPSALGVQTVRVTFSEEVTFAPGVVTAEKVEFDDEGNEVGAVTIPSENITVSGSSTSEMLITFADSWQQMVDTWVRITLADTVADTDSHALDGDPAANSSGLGYIYDAALDLPSGNALAGGDAVFYVGSLRPDMYGYGPGNEEPDGEITPWDITGFTQRYSSDNLDADMYGYGPGNEEPDGDINPWDISGFTSRYSAAMAAGTHLDPLPTAGEGAMAAGAPAPLPLVAAESALALTDAPEVALLARTDEPDASDTQPAEQPTTVLPALATVPAASDHFADEMATALTADSGDLAAPPAWSPLPAHSSADLDIAAIDSLFDPLALPALDVRL